MLIQQPQLISIRENKPTLVKNFVTLKKKYDFNLLSQFMEENDSTVMSHSSIGNLRAHSHSPFTRIQKHSTRD